MEKKTVFVIGAGASKEANLPTGDELRSKIADSLNFEFDHRTLKSGDYVTFNALSTLANNSNFTSSLDDYCKAALHIRDAMPQAISIDNFLDAHRGNSRIVMCGKLSIVKNILEAERNSLLYFENSNIHSSLNFQSLENTWYTPFFKLLSENCDKDEIKERFKSISLIIFNYDRCLEHYLFYALQNYYKLSGDEAAETIGSLNIYHPYGSVGNLPWSNKIGVMEFGAEANSDQIIRMADNIVTFTESISSESNEIKALREKVEYAHTLVFLGFSFHKLNIELISPVETKRTDYSGIACFSSTYQISESDKAVIDAQIQKIYKPIITTRMANLKCGAFFSEFWRSLAF